MITKANDNFIKHIEVSDPVISDHSAVHCELSIKKPGLERREITYRNLRSIDRECFSQDIRNSELANYDKFESVSALIDCYESTLSRLLEQHAPIKKRVVTLRPAAPWYNDHIRMEKAKRRKLERIWRKNKLTINREMFVEQCKCVNRLIADSRMKFYADTIQDNSSNPRVLFSTFVKLLHLKATPKLPSHENAIDLANTFAEFFENKVRSLRDNMLEVTDLPQASTCHIPTELLELSPTNVTELSSLLRTTAGKSCILDPVPGALLKDCYDVLLPVIVRIVNLSLDNATVPMKLKEAALTPIIKKEALDHELYPSYRPISNLRFVSKAIEKVVAARLNEHLNNGDLMEPFQSAYRAGHSTETALTRVHNDVLRAIDDGQCVILILLDLSAAFDTVDHSILLNRLDHCFGIRGKALTWFQSYLLNRSQFVYVENERSSSRCLKYGVPQGSVLGPMLYSIYTAPLANVIKQHNMSYHFYADDTQIYLSFCQSAAGEPEHSTSRVELCIKDVEQWMMINKLKLNGDKTELLVLNARHRPTPTLNSIYAGSDYITASTSARNIGVWFDNLVSMDKQIASICKSAFYHLNNIAKIRKFISFKHCETLIHAFITSKLDYCNSVLSGLSKNQTQRLQFVQNSAARLLMGTNKYDNITPILRQLHWLPVTERIDYKILLLTFKSLHGMAPEYLSELLSVYKPGRSLRSSGKSLLVTPKYNLKSYGQRAFSCAAPALWNSLPDDIRSCNSLTVFKSKLKTFLFKRYFIS